MTGADHVSRAIAACRRAGLPIVEPDDCTCGLRGRLVVLAGPAPLRVIWPYDQRCPIHARHDRERPHPAARAGDVRSRSPAARKEWAAGEGEAAVIAATPLHQPPSHAAGRLPATGTVQLRDLGSEPDWHRKRVVSGPWWRDERVVRRVADDELAPARGFGNAECAQRLVGELGRTLHRTEDRR